jgi:hypothetical protein
MSGYREKELLGSPHSILRHQDMPKIIFKLLWEHVQNGKEIFAYVKNRTKDDNFYWVFAHVTPSYSGDGKIVGYHSVRRKPTPQALKIIIELYQILIEAERSSGIGSAQAILDKKLLQAGKAYDEFIISL